MKLVVAWPDWSTRQDRCVMFSWMAEWVDRVFLVTSVPLPNSLRCHIHPRCRVVYVEPPARGVAFIWAAGRIAKRLVHDAARRNEKIVFQELAMTRLVPQALIGRWLPRHLFRSVLSIYSPSPTFLRTRGWRPNRKQKLSPGQEWLHFRVTLTRIVTEMLYSRIADAVTGNSKEICQEIVRTYRKKPESVHLMPTAVDTSCFTPCRRQSAGKPILLFLGRVYARKGIYDLLEAAGMLRSRNLNFELRILGEDRVERDQVREAIAANQLQGTVHIVSRQPRETVRDELQAASMLVLPSYVEGSPRAVKEAMACGCPVVATDLPGIRSLDPAQAALTLVPIGNPSALADAIKSLLCDESRRKVVGERGRQLAEERFSAPIVARRWLDLYLSLFE